MTRKFEYDSEGNYHDDDIRIESYAETADLKNDPLVEKVVQEVQRELADTIDNTASVKEIKIQAMYRFIDLIEKKLLTPNEADRCYQRFVQMVHYYYGNM